MRMRKMPRWVGATSSVESQSCVLLYSSVYQSYACGPVYKEKTCPWSKDRPPYKVSSREGTPNTSLYKEERAACTRNHKLDSEVRVILGGESLVYYKKWLWGLVNLFHGLIRNSLTSQCRGAHFQEAWNTFKCVEWYVRPQVGKRIGDKQSTNFLFLFTWIELVR